MRGLTRMKGRAAATLSCRDEKEEVSLSEVRLIEFAPTVLHQRCAETASSAAPDLSHMNREVLQTLKKNK